ncbi:MAG TPA: hypothetical protein VKI65_11900 [Gemmataceae bacterium]|nr:hypothetical protein [Gemmataceae bacterium]
MAATWKRRCFAIALLATICYLPIMPGSAFGFFPPHYGDPPPHHTPPPPWHQPPPPDNPPPTDHLPEPATLISGALGMGLLSLYAAARRKRNKS